MGVVTWGVGRRSLVVAAVAAVGMVGAAAAFAQATAGAPTCKPNDRTYCKGTATIRFGKKAYRYTSVVCYLDRRDFSLAEIWKPDEFVLRVTFLKKTARKSASASLVARHPGTARPVIANKRLTVRVDAKQRKGTFSGHVDIAGTPLSGSFTCR